MGAMPLAPARSWRHTSGAVLPTPHSSPRPVTTTLRADAWSNVACLNVLLAAFRVLLDVVDRVLYGLDLLGVLVGNLEVEGFLKLHHQFDHVERIGAQVLLKAGAGRDFGFVHLQLLDDDLFHLFFNGHAYLLDDVSELKGTFGDCKTFGSTPAKPTIPGGSRVRQTRAPLRCAEPRNFKSTGQGGVCKGKEPWKLLEKQAIGKGNSERFVNGW